MINLSLEIVLCAFILTPAYRKTWWWNIPRHWYLSVFKDCYFSVL